LASRGPSPFDAIAYNQRDAIRTELSGEQLTENSSHARKHIMDRLVRRVTVIQGSGEQRAAKVVYERDEDEDEDEDEDRESPNLQSLERTIRHVLKARVIAAEDAYKRHLDAAAKGGNSWLIDDAFNMMKMPRKAVKEMRKASPFGRVKIEVEDEEDDEDEGD
jgi:hypothetical protein